MRTPTSRFLVTILLLALLPWLPRSASAAPAPLFDAARLKQYADKDPHRLFEDPRVTCALKQLLTPAEYKALTDRMEVISVDEKDEDGLGATVFSGGVNGLYSIMEGIVMVEPSGRLWAAYIDGEQVDYFTNDRAFLTKPPKTLDTWREDFKEKAVVAVTAKRGLPARPVTEACAVSMPAPPSPTACTEKNAFSDFEPAVVKAGAPGRKVYFYSEPVACKDPAPCPSRKKAYLVENDAVALSTDSTPKDGFVCARYTGAKGTVTTGWMQDSELNHDLLKAPPGAKSPGSKPADWVGNWKQPHASLTIKPAGAQGILVKGEASNGANTGDFEATYKPTGPIATPPKDEDGGCEVSLRLLNNALFVNDNGRCGGLGVGFGGLFHRASK